MNKEEQLDRNGGKTHQTHLSSYSFLIFRINDTNFRLFIQVCWDSLVFQFFKMLIIYNKKKCNSCKIVSLQDLSAGLFQIILSIPRNMYTYSDTVDTVDNTINDIFHTCTTIKKELSSFRFHYRPAYLCPSLLQWLIRRNIHPNDWIRKASATL